MFLFIFLTIYYLINFYFSRKMRVAFNLKKGSEYIISIFLTLSIILYKFMDKNLIDNFIMSFSILLWMGFVILFFVLYILIDFYNVSLKVIHILTGHNPVPKVGIKKGFIIVSVLTISITAYGYYETLNLNVYRFTLYSNKVDRDIKILHISDLHLNQVMREDKIRAILEVYQKEKPDIVISTGDLVDGNMSDKINYIRLLWSIDPPFGKYAIIGNHEYYAGINQAIEFTKKSGFLILRDEYVYLPFNLAILGVDDDEAKRFGVLRKMDDDELLDRVDKGRFIIFLRHQPRINGGIAGKFDLALSGHTHGGVLFPVKYILRKIFITDFGLIKLGSSYIYVSRGVGTGGPPIRIGSPPDVAIFEIKKSP